MNWEVRYLPEALDDLLALDGSQRLLVRKAIAKVQIREKDRMIMIVVGAREDDEVYDIAHQRMQKHNLS